MMKLTKRLPIVLAAAAAASQLGATNCGQVTRDPGFDLWCGDQLCAWKVERGTVARAPTWNEGDPGVSLLGADTAIEQLTPVTSTDGTCLEFTMIANIDLDAQVTLNIDVDGDGTVERSEQLPTSSWKPLKFLVAIGAPYAGVRFELAKTGDGSAELADIDAQISTDCDASLPALDARPAPLGAPCDGSADCASGQCAAADDLPGNGVTAGVCVGCTATSCGSGSVCGAGDAVSAVDAVPFACVPPGSKQLGELCAGDIECATDICTYGACSTCRAGSGAGSAGSCTGGETCGPDWPTAFGVFAPWVCSPGGGLRTSGQPCAANADCTSGACTGSAYSECSDGRPCTNASECPLDSTLENGDCTVVGIADGACD